MQVRVVRPGVTVRARRDFRYDRRTAVSREPDEIVADLLRSATLAQEVPIEVTTYALQAPEGKGRIRLLVAANIDRGVAAPAKVTVGFVFFDANGRTIGNSFDQGELSPAPASGGALGYAGAAIVQPGTYTLRLAAVDASGRRGSVEHAVEARLTEARGVALGDLIVMDMDDPGGTSGMRPSVRTAVRDALAAYLEIYGIDADGVKKLAARLEIAGPEDGAALASTPMELDAKVAGRVAASARLPLGVVPPGDYLARATITVDGTPAGRVVRPLRVEAPTGAGPRAGSAPFVVARSVVRPFDPGEVLQPAVLGHFLDRLAEFAGETAAGATAKAVAEARAGRFDAVLDAVSQNRSGDLATHFLRGIALYSKGSKKDLENAALEFRAALRASPDFLAAVFYLGACYSAGMREDEAAGAWQTSLVSEHASPHVFRFLADNLLRRGEIDLAQEILAESLALFPEDEELKRRQALAYAMTGRASQAIELLDARLAAHPEDHEALLLALSCLFELHGTGQLSAGDRERAARYAARYAKSAGDKQALVALWMEAITRQ